MPDRSNACSPRLQLVIRCKSGGTAMLLSWWHCGLPLSAGSCVGGCSSRRCICWKGNVSVSFSLWDHSACSLQGDPPAAWNLGSAPGIHSVRTDNSKPVCWGWPREWSLPLSLTLLISVTIHTSVAIAISKSYLCLYLHLLLHHICICSISNLSLYS